MPYFMNCSFDNGEWRSELVGNIGEKMGFHPVQFFQFVLLFFQKFFLRADFLI